ncbi:MAG: phosphoribosyl-AMP cyclohydrolase [Parasphingorhabdus sp.]
MNKHENDRENGSQLIPKYDSNGLISAVVTDDSSGDLLMVAFMNAEALKQTLESGDVHFFSRSRQTLWKKGETSGNVLKLSEIRIDCDQDAVWVKAKPAGPTCHTGEWSCFYRKIENGKLERVE